MPIYKLKTIKYLEEFLIFRDRKGEIFFEK